ncbi:MAG: DUF2157 domain-containing protein [Bacteroidetes bacterium SW_9_63_38]|nr:MAG: DUF2157 domain-containing protein [Bacteroidetes bacterium SW_9_63_38]
MELKKKEARVVARVIDQWEEEQVVDEETADRLRESYEVASFNWRLLAKYAFWGAIACFLIATGALVADDFLLKLLRRVFASNAINTVLLGSCAVGLFYYGHRRVGRYPRKIYSTGAIYALGAIAAAGAVFFFGRVVASGTDDPSFLILLTSVIYGGVAVLLPSATLWVFCLATLGGWFGMVTGYHHGTYVLGMNYPLRFTLFGGVMIAGRVLLERTERLRSFSRYTHIIGLLYFFISLWLLSIFGNYGAMDAWYDAGHLELLHWSLLFAVAAAGAIVYGLKYGDAIARKFGVTFLFINLYTKFFEFFWEPMHKAVVFGVLGFSLWLIGRNAESIWRLTFLRDEPSPSQD